MCTCVVVSPPIGRAPAPAFEEVERVVSEPQHGSCLLARDFSKRVTSERTTEMLWRQSSTQRQCALGLQLASKATPLLRDTSASRVHDTTRLCGGTQALPTTELRAGRGGRPLGAVTGTLSTLATGT